jgi:hypothetical protein
MADRSTSFPGQITVWGVVGGIISANNLVIDLLELGDSERAHELDERMGRSEPGRSVGGRRRILANHSFLSPEP